MAANGRPPKNIIELPQLPKLPKFDLPPGRLRAIFLVVLIGAALFSSIYTIDPEEVGVVLRFGKFVRTSNPGLHFKAPLGIERVIKLPVQRQLKQEFGFQSQRSDVRTPRSMQGESNMLTGDLNAAVVEWVVQYRIDDPQQFLFRVRNVEETLRDMSEAVMRQVVGDRTVDEVLTVGRQEVADLAELKLQELCDQYENGIKIEQVVLQDVNPPDQVKASFNEVNQAEQERETKINQAQSEYNKVIFRARGQAENTVSTAEGYALDRVNRARGEADRFISIYRAYRKAPEVTRRRIYLETLNEVMNKAGRKVILDERLEGLMPILDLEGKLGGLRSGGTQP
ncbi:MAG: FtsH protease activity modulator HflK [Acidobacteria bacterium]|nr:FtsH protease activity modulator HflK [Acidobacteriota bacterium]